MTKELQERDLEAVFLNEHDEAILATLVSVHLECDPLPSAEGDAADEEPNVLTATFTFEPDNYFAAGSEVLTVAFQRKGSALVSTTGCALRWSGLDPTVTILGLSIHIPCNTTLAWKYIWWSYCLCHYYRYARCSQRSA